jgi:hypothetical protein
MCGVNEVILVQHNLRKMPEPSRSWCLWLASRVRCAQFMESILRAESSYISINEWGLNL